MKIEIKLVTSHEPSDEGYPLVLEIAHKNKRKTKRLAFSLEKHFVAGEKLILHKHADYDILVPIIMNLKLKARKLILQRLDDVEKVYEALFSLAFVFPYTCLCGFKILHNQKTN